MYILFSFVMMLILWFAWMNLESSFYFSKTTKVLGIGIIICIIIFSVLGVFFEVKEFNLSAKTEIAQINTFNELYETSLSNEELSGEERLGLVQLAKEKNDRIIELKTSRGTLGNIFYTDEIRMSIDALKRVGVQP